MFDDVLWLLGLVSIGGVSIAVSGAALNGVGVGFPFVVVMVGLVASLVAAVVTPCLVGLSHLVGAY